MSLDEPLWYAEVMAGKMACEKLGERLFQCRKEAQLGLLALSKLAGVAHTTIGDIEKGRQMPAADTIERLARALSISPCWLAYGIGARGLDKVPD